MCARETPGGRDKTVRRAHRADGDIAAEIRRAVLSSTVGEANVVDAMLYRHRRRGNSGLIRSSRRLVRDSFHRDGNRAGEGDGPSGNGF